MSLSNHSRECFGLLEPCLATIPDLVLAYLFGSRTKAGPGPLSDYDLAVLFDEAVPQSEYLKRRLEIVLRLEPSLGARLDVTVLNEATPLLAHRVISTGELVFCRDEVLRVRFETTRINEYLDTRYLDDEYDRALTARIREGRFLGRS